MLDPHLLRTELEQTARQLERRGYSLDVPMLQELEQQRKAIQVETQTLQNERNTRSKSIGKAKAAGEDIQPLLDEVASLGDKLKAAEEKLAEVQARLTDIQLGIPNILHDSVPDGKDEEDNVEVRRFSEPTKLDFEPHDHVDLGAGLGQMDFEVATKITGSRFSFMRGAIASMHRALTQFMIDTHTRKHGYTEVYVPILQTVTACMVPGSYQSLLKINLL